MNDQEQVAVAEQPKASRVTVEIEIDSAHNSNLYFAPAGVLVRGRFSMMRFGQFERNALALQNDPLAEIPGQVIGIDPANRRAWIDEPLQFPQHAKLAKLIEKARFALPERQDFTLPEKDRHYCPVSTWLYWMKDAVDLGVAKLVRGQFPDELPGTPRKEFLVRDDDSHEAMFKKLIAILWSKLSAKERAEFPELAA